MKTRRIEYVERPKRKREEKQVEVREVRRTPRTFTVEIIDEGEGGGADD